MKESDDPYRRTDQSGLDKSSHGRPASPPEFVVALEAFGEAPALIMGAGVVTYAELARRAASFAAGLGPGRKLIAIEAALSSHAIAAYLGALRGGHAVILLPADDEGVRLAIEDRFHPDLC